MKIQRDSIVIHPRSNMDPTQYPISTEGVDRLGFSIQHTKPKFKLLECSNARFLTSARCIALIISRYARILIEKNMSMQRYRPKHSYVHELFIHRQSAYFNKE